MLFSGFTQPSMFYKTAVISKLQGVNKALYYCMDAELWLRYLMQSNNFREKIVEITQPIAHFRIHPSAKSRNTDAHKRELLCIYESLMQKVGISCQSISQLKVLPPLRCSYRFECEIIESINKKKLIAYSFEWFLNRLHHYYNIKQSILLYRISLFSKPLGRSIYFYSLPLRLIRRKLQSYMLNIKM
jgi:hypothetical protein